MAYKYFLYSASQLNKRKELEAKMGKTFIPGTVLYKGQKVIYTELSSVPNPSHIPDSKIVAQGEVPGIKYTPGRSR